MIDDDMLQKRMPAIPDFPEPECVVEEDEDETPQPATFLRVFTYPVSGPGLSIIGIYAGVPFILGVLTSIAFVVLMPLAIIVGFAAMLINPLIVLSTFWYLTVCIRASAEGQAKAPNIFEFSQDDSPWDWLRELFFVVLTVFLCIAPAFIVKHYTGSVPAFWGILGAGIFFLPMVLLSVVMFDSISAFNPIVIIGSIFSTLFSYLVIVLLFFIPIGLLVGIKFLKILLPIPFLSLVIDAAGLYLLMMDTYLLGRFFYNNEEKLRWDV